MISILNDTFRKAVGEISPINTLFEAGINFGAE